MKTSLEEMAQSMLRDQIGGFVMQAIQAQAQVQLLTARTQSLEAECERLKKRLKDIDPTWQADH